MNRKTIFTLIAVILCLSVVGVCYALYSTEAQKNVGISAHGGVSLKLNSGESLAISGLNPDNTSGTYQVELNVSGSDIDENVKGVFYVVLSGELINGVTVSASARDKNSSVTALDHSMLINPSVGYQCVLGSLPATVDLTFSLTNDAINNFANYANKILNVELRFEIVEGSVWTPDPTGYYLVGSPSNGLLNNDNYKLVADGGSYFIKNVEFKANDTFKIYNNGSYIATVDSANSQNVATSAGYNISVPTAGVYTVKYTPNTGVSVYIPLTRVYYYKDDSWTGVKIHAADELSSPVAVNASNALSKCKEAENEGYYYVDLPANVYSFALYDVNSSDYEVAQQNGMASEFFQVDGREEIWIKNGVVSTTRIA